MFPRDPRGLEGLGGLGDSRSARGLGGPRGASLREVSFNLLSLIINSFSR